MPGSNDRDRGYWRDVGTMGSYFAAHMDLVAPLPIFNLYNTEWPIYTTYGPQPPAKLVEGDHGKPIKTFNSLLSPGVVVTGGQVNRSVLSPGVPRRVRRRGLRLGAAAGRADRRGRGDPQRDHGQERRGAARASGSGSTPRPTRARGLVVEDGLTVLAKGQRVAEQWQPGRDSSPRTSDLVDVPALVTAYYTEVPDPEDVDQQVVFGTSGHRGSSLRTSFNETHILATTQAICDYRRSQGYDGPLFVGADTHALSKPAWATALEVLVANDVTVLVDDRGGYTPTPAVSHAIIRANRGRTQRAGRRHRGHAVAQPARRRRLQVQPAARRPRRLRRHQR